MLRRSFLGTCAAATAPSAHSVCFLPSAPLMVGARAGLLQATAPALSLARMAAMSRMVAASKSARVAVVAKPRGVSPCNGSRRSGGPARAAPALDDVHTPSSVAASGGGDVRVQYKRKYIKPPKGEPELNAEQREVVDYVIKNPGKSVFLTGGAGTGKSVIIRAIARSLSPETTYVTAPTGVAALNIGGITLHSLMRLAPDEQFDLRSIITGKVFADIQRRLWSGTTIIIDEISMVDPSLFQAVDRLAQIVRKSPLPFGGIQLVLCGDFLQLPPVSASQQADANKQDAADDDDDDGDGAAAASKGAKGGPAASSSSSSSATAAAAQQPAAPARFRFGRVQHVPRNKCNADTTSRYCFQTAEWRRLNPRCFALQRVMRQKEPELVELLNAVRFGTQTEAQMQRILLAPEDATVAADIADAAAPVKIFCRNREVNDRNRECFDAIRKSAEFIDRHYDEKAATPDISRRREIVYFCATSGYAKSFSAVIPKTLRLCVGSRVMLLKNLDVTGGLVNGSTGVVVGFRDQSTIDDEEAAAQAAQFAALLRNRKKNDAAAASEAAAPLSGDASFQMKYRDMPSHTLSDCKDIFPVVRFDGVKTPVVVRPALWTQKSGGSVASQLMQLPLRHAWAITAHKAQGMSFDKVHVDLSAAFERGQAYVALSRARTIKYLRVTGYNKDAIKACEIAAAFHRSADAGAVPTSAAATSAAAKHQTKK